MKSVEVALRINIEDLGKHGPQRRGIIPMADCRKHVEKSVRFFSLHLRTGQHESFGPWHRDDKHCPVPGSPHVTDDSFNDILTESLRKV